jgi:predicted GIY-YIG superfamily endonuclease
MDKAKKKHCVYKYVLNDKILYIGLADVDLDKRISQHGKPGDNIPERFWEDINKAEIYYIVLANSVMADVVEKELIRRHKPKCNKAYTDSEWSGIPFAEPEWVRYQKPEPIVPRQISPRVLSETLHYEDIDNNNIQALDQILYYKKKLQRHLYAEKHEIFVKDTRNNQPLQGAELERILPTVKELHDSVFSARNCLGHLETHDNKTFIVFENVTDALANFEVMISMIKQHHENTIVKERECFGWEPEYRYPLRYRGILW